MDGGSRQASAPEGGEDLHHREPAWPVRRRVRFELPPAPPARRPRVDLLSLFGVEAEHPPRDPDPGGLQHHLIPDGHGI